MREDIQSLRGLAAIFVFCYHLFPNLFVNGYLGVDIFFVITGYLVAVHVTKNKFRKCKDFFKYFYWRFTRILPLHFVAVAISMLLTRLYIGADWWGLNNKYGLSALFCGTNHHLIHENWDYFHFITNRDSLNALAHMWSLSVEMQFYVLVPFIFFPLQFVKSDACKLVVIFGIVVASLIVFSVLTPLFAFNFMLCRLWQFLVGVMVVYWTNADVFGKLRESEKSEKSTLPPIVSMTVKALTFKSEEVVSCSLVVLSVCLIPSRLNIWMVRFAVTIATALILANESLENKLLSFAPLTYIGDISFALYLIHWPIIAIFIGTTVNSHIFCIVTSLVSAAFLHHFVEKVYRKLSFKPTMFLMAILFFTNGYLQQSMRRHTFWKDNMLTEDAAALVEKNKESLPNAWRREYKIDHCTETIYPNLDDRKHLYMYCRYNNGHGKPNMLMIGNTFVLNFVDHMRYFYHYMYNEWRHLALKEGHALYADSEQSRESLEVMKRAVETYKPDVLFVFASFSESVRGRVRKNDEYVKQMNENLAFYEKHVKKIYILEPHYTYKWNSLALFLHYAIHKPEDLESLHLDRKETMETMKNIRKRFSMIKCSKCSYFNICENFRDGDKYLTFDRETMMSYADNTNHLTIAGLKTLYTDFDKLARKVMADF